MPAPAYFGVSAVFHYLGPAFAVLLFARVDVLGVAWLRIASAAVVFAVWRRPWRLVRRLEPAQRRVLLGLGVVLAAMNATFYLAIARLPLATVGAIEFLGTIVLAAVGVRNGRNVIALVLAVGGVVALTDIQLAGEPLGFVFAFANCALFMLYVVLGHRIANTGAGLRDRPAGRRDADRRGGRDTVLPRRRGPGLHQPGGAAGRRRRGHLLVGHPLCDRPARHGPVTPATPSR